MALTPGTRLDPCEITGQIGVGGMGEVYRATDTKLKRDVAVKVLPSHVAADPERLARFQREAEVLAALNHPNIAARFLGVGASIDAPWPSPASSVTPSSPPARSPCASASRSASLDRF